MRLKILVYQCYIYFKEIYIFWFQIKHSVNQKFQTVLTRIMNNNSLPSFGICLPWKNTQAYLYIHRRKCQGQGKSRQEWVKLYAGKIPVDTGTNSRLSIG